jgi:hypothetical protein
VASNIHVTTGSTEPFKKVKRRQRSAQQKETQILRGVAALQFAEVSGNGTASTAMAYLPLRQSGQNGDWD